jgi:hypothetical protein
MRIERPKVQGAAVCLMRILVWVCWMNRRHPTVQAILLKLCCIWSGGSSMISREVVRPIGLTASLLSVPRQLGVHAIG